MTPDPGDRTAALPTPAGQDPAPARPERAAVRLAGRYRLVELVGRGGSAEVWAAEDEALGRRVAVKLVTATGGEDAGRVGDEARLLARLSHPGLVPVYDAGTDDAGRPFVVMELVLGETLADAVGRGPMAPEQVAPVGRVLAEALAYVHGEGLVHRDVKPANVLLGRDGRVRLTDFGIARLVDAAKVTATGLTVGTASYLSPEQVRGAAVGPLSDVYSLGLVLLECLRGEREYPGTTVEVAVARLHRSPVVPDGLPSGWTPLLRAMTAQDPAERPTAFEVARDLAAVAAGGQATTVVRPVPVEEPTSVLPRTRAEPAPRPRPARYEAVPAPPPPRSSSGWPWAVALVVVVLLAVGGFLLYDRTSGGTGPAPAPVSPSLPDQLRSDLQQLQDAVSQAVDAQGRS